MDRVDDLGRQLAAAGLRSGDVLVAVLPRGLAAIEVLACLAGEYTFAPVPVTWTEQALAEAITELRPAVVLAEPDRVRSLAAAGVIALPVTGAIPSDLPGQPVLPRQYPGIAYLMHTSGSSGRPKCVLVPFDALVNAATGLADFLGLTGADRVLQFAQPAFDVFFEEVIPTLSAWWLAGAARHGHAGRGRPGGADRVRRGERAEPADRLPHLGPGRAERAAG